MGPSVAFVGHSFHKKTRSEDFFVSILERHGCDVQRFWCEEWQRGPTIPLKDVKDFPVVIMWQSLCSSLRPYARCADNITFVPMLDDYVRNAPGALEAFGQDTQRWRALGGTKILSFSHTVHAAMQRMGLYSECFQCYPEPSHTPCVREGLHAFFWLRQGDIIGLDCLRILMGNTPFDSLHIHAAADPGASGMKILEEWQGDMPLSLSTWFEDKAHYLAVLREKNVFFAPRAVEGIGFSFLEGLSLGQCVVAPNFPTMNEYIRHAVNGLLYDLQTPQPLDFSNAWHLGEQARIDAVKGYERWRQDEERMVQYIMTPNKRCYASWHQVPLAPKMPYKQILKSIIWLRPLWRLYSALKPKLQSILTRRSSV